MKELLIGFIMGWCLMISGYGLVVDFGLLTIVHMVLYLCGFIGLIWEAHNARVF